MSSEVTPEQAIELLHQTQQVSPYFRDFDFQQLLDLSDELTILHFRAGETVLFQGQPATFFGVLLQGSLLPVVGDAPVGEQRAVGDIIGEMALFSGGTRNVSMVATADGYLAVVQFAQLEQLKGSNPGLADKINDQLARAALSKQIENEVWNNTHPHLTSSSRSCDTPPPTVPFCRRARGGASTRSPQPRCSCGSQRCSRGKPRSGGSHA